MLKENNLDGISWKISQPDISDNMLNTDEIINSMTLNKGGF